MIWRFLHITEDGDVFGTDDETVAKAISQVEQVIDTKNGTLLRSWHEDHEKAVVPILAVAHPGDWLTP